jgi:NAD:arginine ADP-ribosyltransferase
MEEKALIYWYTDSGSMGLNELLSESKGKKISKLGEYLDIVLSKLPNFEGITFRGAKLSDYEISKYQQALDNETSIIDHTFMSSSRLKNKANEYRRTVMFEIFSKNGKLIEKVSKFVNEQEVLFRRNSQFRVLDIEKRDSYVYILLQEI